MSKSQETQDVVTEWCGRAPERGSDALRMLWEETHPDVPFENEGAELLVRMLKAAFTDRTINLRPVDILELTLDGLVDAIPDVLADVAMAAVAPVAPMVVTLSDESIERLATRIAQLLAAASAESAQALARTSKAAVRPAAKRAGTAKASTRAKGRR